MLQCTANESAQLHVSFFFCGLLTTGYSYVNQCLLFFLVLMQETAMVSTQEGLILALILIGIALCIPATLFCFFFLCANVKCIGIFINYFTQFVSFVFFPTNVTQGPFFAYIKIYKF